MIRRPWHGADSSHAKPGLATAFGTALALRGISLPELRFRARIAAPATGAFCYGLTVRSARLPWILAVLLPLAPACKDKAEPTSGPEKEAPAAAVEESAPPPVEEIVEPEPRKLSADGAVLFQAGQAVLPPVVWEAGLTSLRFEAEAQPSGKAQRIHVRMWEDEESTEIVSCETSYPIAMAYLDSESIAYVVCETEHSEAAPGMSAGVRLEWKDGQLRQAGSFENEGPPAYATMDFGEDE